MATTNSTAGYLDYMATPRKVAGLPVTRSRAASRLAEQQQQQWQAVSGGQQQQQQQDGYSQGVPSSATATVPDYFSSSSQDQATQSSISSTAQTPRTLPVSEQQQQPLPSTPRGQLANSFSSSVKSTKRKSSDETSQLSRSTRSRGNDNTTNPSWSSSSGFQSQSGREIDPSMPLLGSRQTLSTSVPAPTIPPIPSLPSSYSCSSSSNITPASRKISSLFMSVPASYTNTPGSLYKSMPASASALQPSSFQSPTFAYGHDSTNGFTVDDNDTESMFSSWNFPASAPSLGLAFSDTGASTFFPPSPSPNGNHNSYFSAGDPSLFAFNANPSNGMTGGTAANMNSYPYSAPAHLGAVPPEFMQSQPSPFYNTYLEQATASLLPDLGQSNMAAIPPATPSSANFFASSTPLRHSTTQSNNDDEAMALFASQVRRKAEKLSLSDNSGTGTGGEPPSPTKAASVFGNSLASSTNGYHQQEPTMPMQGEQSKVTETPKKKRGHHNKKKNSISRPPNAWILYRSAMVEEMKADNTMGKRLQADISKTISVRWSLMSAAEKQLWADKAAAKAAEHAILYPDWKFQPSQAKKSNSSSAEPSPSKNKTLSSSTNSNVSASYLASAAIGLSKSMPASTTSMPSVLAQVNTPASSSRTTGRGNSNNIFQARDDVPVPSLPEHLTGQSCVPRTPSGQTMVPAMSTPFRYPRCTTTPRETKSAKPESMSKGQCPSLPPMPTPISGKKLLQNNGKSIFDQTDFFGRQDDAGAGGRAASPSPSRKSKVGKASSMAPSSRNIRSLDVAAKWREMEAASRQAPQQGAQQRQQVPQQQQQHHSPSRASSVASSARASTRPRYQQATATSLARSATLSITSAPAAAATTPRRPSAHQTSAYSHLHPSNLPREADYAAIDQLMQDVGLASAPSASVASVPPGAMLGSLATPGATPCTSTSTWSVVGGMQDQGHSIFGQASNVGEAHFEFLQVPEVFPQFHQGAGAGAGGSQHFVPVQQNQSLLSIVSGAAASYEVTRSQSHQPSWQPNTSVPPPSSYDTTSMQRGYSAPSSAAYVDGTPVPGLLDGIVVAGVHYPVENTVALLEDIINNNNQKVVDNGGGPLFGATSTIPGLVSATGEMIMTPDPLAQGQGQEMWAGQEWMVDPDTSGEQGGNGTIIEHDVPDQGAEEEQQEQLQEQEGDDQEGGFGTGYQGNISLNSVGSAKSGDGISQYITYG